jgi:hypothetical protein
MPSATNPGPGQKPAMPQPMPSIKLPAMSRRSMLRAVGSRIGAPANETVRNGAAARHDERDRADDDGAGHHERQRRIPGAREVEEAEHLGRVGHSGHDEPEAEHQVGQQRSENEHGRTLRT